MAQGRVLGAGKAGAPASEGLVADEGIFAALVTDRRSGTVAGNEADVVAIAAGDAHSCALTLAGGVKCWGRNVEGQLGRGTFGTLSDRFPAPDDVATLTSDVRAIAAGKLRGIVLDGVWIHVGTPEARGEAEDYLAALSPA